MAAGEPLSLVWHGGRLRGHAIECRVNAEDPDNNFLPCPGMVQTYHPPGGPGIRVDTHIYAGYMVPPFYDSLSQALDSFIVEGVTTTIPFLRRVIHHPDFQSGSVDTKFLERETDLFEPTA